MNDREAVLSHTRLTIAAGGLVAPFLIGLASGSRAFTPLAVVSLASPGGDALRGRPARTLTSLLAAGEMLGDKLPAAPNRTIGPALVVRALTASIAGAALARPGQARTGALLSASVAVASASASLTFRTYAMRHLGRVSSGLIEDVLAIALARLAVRHGARS